MWLSFEILPHKLALAKPAGFGRSAPNSNPTLPPPTGRINWLKMFNPLYFLKTLVGPEKFRKYVTAIVFVVVVIPPPHTPPPPPAWYFALFCPTS